MDLFFGYAWVSHFIFLFPCGDDQGVNKDSYLILETLPTEYDSRVKAMEVDERPTEQYSDIGGLDKQIQEVRYYHLYLISLDTHMWM